MLSACHITILNEIFIRRSAYSFANFYKTLQNENMSGQAEAIKTLQFTSIKISQSTIKIVLPNNRKQR